MNNYMINDTYFEKKYKIIIKHYLAKLVWLILYSRNSSYSQNNIDKLNSELLRMTRPILDTQYKSLNQWSKITDEIIANVKGKGIASFLQWNCIKETMGEENSSFLYEEYNYLKKS